MDGSSLRSGCRCRPFVGLLLLTLVPAAAHADIDLQWRPTPQTVAVGDGVDLALYAVSDTAEDQLLSLVEVIFTWDPAYLELLGLDQGGAVSLMYSGFPSSGDCDLNELVPPEDGDGFYRAWAYFGDPVAATPEGTLLTTFEFEALLGTVGPTDVLMLSSNGACRTVVVDGLIPGLDVTGELGSATVTITCVTNADCNDGLFCNGEETCDGDSCVAGTDPCPGQWCDEVADICVDCPSFGDFNDDCDVDLEDYVIFEDCLSGPGAVPTPSLTTVQQCLDAFDTEGGDGDVDLEEFAAFQAVFTGPYPPPGCW